MYKRQVEELKARIVAGLLPAQREFVLDTEHKVLGFCAGFGAGKTRALCAKVVYLALLNPGTVAAVFEPTHILLRDVWMRSFDDYLEEYQIEHEFRVSPQPEYQLHVPGGTTTLLCRATETWNRIRGQNLSFICALYLKQIPSELGVNLQLFAPSAPQQLSLIHI